MHMKNQQAIQIAEGIYCVGAIDKDAPRFHGYHVSHGVTFNAYLVRGTDGKYTLIDTVHRDKTDELLGRIASVTEPKNITALIINHTEPDHSGAVPAILQTAKPVVYATVAAAKFLQAMYGTENVQTVKSGDTREIGGRTYSFLATPMVHWPDNMVTYLPNEKILFSNDAFGQHFATNQPLDTQNNINTALTEAQHYFANIVMPYRAQAAKAVDAALSLPLDMIAPSHGVVWTKNIDRIGKLYQSLCTGKSVAATLVFDSLWGGTAERAQEACDELRKTYEKITVFDLRTDHMSDVMAALAASKHLCIGSPTYNGYPTPRIGTLVAEVEALRPPVTEYSLFGTFAWGGGASKHLTQKLDALGLQKTFDLTRA